MDVAVGPRLPGLAGTFDSIGVLVDNDRVGDGLIKLPFLRALRAAFGEARIHWIAAQGQTAYGGPLQPFTGDLIDVIHERPDWLAAGAAEIPRFELLIDTRDELRAARRAKRAVPHRVFIAMAGRYLLSDRQPALLQRFRRPAHLVDRLLLLVHLAAGYRPPTEGRLPLASEPVARARALLPDGPTYVGLAPGAGAARKIWPRERFVRLARQQAARGRRPVFLLGPEEQDWMAELAAEVPAAAFPLQGGEPGASPAQALQLTLAVAGRLALGIANDSGTGHMLAAADCPLISLFGPTNPAKLAPRVTPAEVIRAQQHGGKTMDDIPWQAVDQAAERMLRRAASASTRSPIARSSGAVSSAQ